MGWGMNTGNMHTSKLDLYTTVLDTVFKLDRQKSKDKEYMVFKTISMFWTAVHFFFMSTYPAAGNCFQKN